MSACSYQMLSGLIAPRIEPVPAGVERPLWSVMIPTFNRMTYLHRALESVLAQDPGRDQMQIEVVDDCSTTDDPEPIVDAVAGGRVTISRNLRNLGLMPNLNRCIERARGHLIHLLHSDDYVEQKFYASIGGLAAKYPDCAVLASRVFFVDEAEVITWVSERANWMETPTHEVKPMLHNLYHHCPGVVVRRTLYEQCGGFLPELAAAGDWEMWVRAVHYGGGVMHCQPLADWRRSAEHESARLARSGEYVREFLRLSNHLVRYPGFSPSALPELAASEALKLYYRFAAEGDIAAAQANLKAYKEAVPFPAWAITGLLNRLSHYSQRTSRFVERATRSGFVPGLKVKLNRS
jgi:Glycosyl transferase family 2